MGGMTPLIDDGIPLSPPTRNACGLLARYWPIGHALQR
jgi:hypothetical protein